MSRCSQKKRVPGLRLGGTSFLKQDRYVPAVRFAAEFCDDIALLLFETGEKGEYLISAAEVREIAAIGAGEGVTFNIHLPTDADFATHIGARRMTDNVLRAVERTQSLHPQSFVLHVDVPPLARTGQLPTPETVAWTARALEDMATALPAPEMLALENLETFPLTFLDVWLNNTMFSRCFDIGHIWKDGLRPESLLKDWLPRTRLCHLHGLERRETGRRDHISLCHLPPATLDAVMYPIWKSDFNGVITLEVFSFDAFTTSHKALLDSYERYCIQS